MNKSIRIRRMVGIAALAAIVVVLQVIANYIQFGPVSITLALIPIVVGAILYGPIAGGILGLVDGLLIFFAPSTIALFYPISIPLTLVVCLLKTGIAGVVSGLLFKALKKVNIILAVVIASIIVPIVNTGLFAIAALLFYRDLLVSFAPAGETILSYLFLTFIGYNFIIEFVVNSALSPAILHIVRIGAKNYNIGSSFDEINSNNHKINIE